MAVQPSTVNTDVLSSILQLLGIPGSGAPPAVPTPTPAAAPTSAPVAPPAPAPTQVPPEIPPAIKALRAESVKAPGGRAVEPQKTTSPPVSVGGAMEPKPLPPATPREFQERVNGWRDYLSRPDVKAALLQFGASMLQGHRGFLGNVGHSIEAAGGAVNRYTASQTAEQERLRKAGLEERQAVVQERRAGAAERQAGASEKSAEASQVTAQAALIRAKKALRTAGIKLDNTLLNTALRETLKAQSDYNLFKKEGDPDFNFDAELMHAYTAALRARAGLPPRTTEGQGSSAPSGGSFQDRLSPEDLKVFNLLKAARTPEDRRKIADEHAAAVKRIRDALRNR